MGLNVLEWIWMNLKYVLIISVLNHHKKRYAPIVSRITNDISACSCGCGDFCGDSEGYN